LGFYTTIQITIKRLTQTLNPNKSTMETIQTSNPSGNAFKVQVFNTIMVAVSNSQIIEGDYWWNLIQSIDPTYKIDTSYPLNRTLFFKTSDEQYHICALDVMMNVATLIFKKSYLPIHETLTQKYLVETIKNIGIKPCVANNIGFKLVTYDIENKNGALSETVLGRALPSKTSSHEKVFKFNDDWSLQTNLMMVGPCFQPPAFVVGFQPKTNKFGF